MADRDACIVGYARTPVGGLNGGLAKLSAPELGALAIRAAVERAKVSPTAVEEVFMGLVLSAGVGQAPARQAALKAGLGAGVPCTAINKVCASGMKAVQFAALSINAGLRDIVVAGGMESMSNAPYLAPAVRQGARMGHTALQDSLLRDGLTDTCGEQLLGRPMGESGELCCREYALSRADLDAHAAESYRRARAAVEAGRLRDEIVAVDAKTTKGKAVEADEEVLRQGDLAAMPKRLGTMKPAFQKEGLITAGNSSKISDGAAALVLCSRKKAKELNLLILAVVRGMADAAQVSERFTTTPAIAIPMAVKHAGLRMEDVDFWEINEAFSAVAVVNSRLLKLDPAKVNAYGGAVAVGHPLGASGARILCTLISVLRQEGGRYGAAGICNGGGGASAVVLEVGDGQVKSRL